MEVSMKKIKYIIIGLFLCVLIGGIGLFTIRKDWEFMVKEYFGIGREKVTVTKLKQEEIDINTFELSQLKEMDSVEFNDSLLLINGDYPITDNNMPIVAYKNTDVQMNECAVEAFADLSEHISEQFDEKLLVTSSYRSPEEQNNMVVNATIQDSAMKVGSSEHQAGLALDVAVKGYGGKSFLKTEEGRFINENCYQHGFIIRYPLMKKSETDITYEPWHIRYVGQPHAIIIYNNNLTLEEYIESLEVGAFYESEGYIISRQKGETLNLPNGCSSYVISPDNTGYYIVTGKQG